MAAFGDGRPAVFRLISLALIVTTCMGAASADPPTYRSLLKGWLTLQGCMFRSPGGILIKPAVVDAAPISLALRIVTLASPKKLLP